MVSESELLALIEAASKYGEIQTESDRYAIIRVRVRIPGFGPGWMPPIMAAERLGEFLATKAVRVPLGPTYGWFRDQPAFDQNGEG